MNKIFKMFVYIIFSLLLIPMVYAESANDMYREIWKIEDAFKGVGELFYIEKYTKLHKFQDKYLLEFRYEKDDINFAMVLMDENGNKLNIKYLISDDNQYRHQLYYYKDKIYLIDDDQSTTIYIYDDNLEKIGTEEELGGNDLTVPIHSVSFVNNSMYIFYREISGKSPKNNTFYVYQYDLDGKYIESFSYDYSSLNFMKVGIEQLSDEVFSKQIYFYDIDAKKSITFNYENNDFEVVDYVVQDEENYSLFLNMFCNSTYLCDYGKVGNYYYVDNHRYTDEDNYTYGNVSIIDEELVELFKFKNYASYKDNLMVKNNDYFIYTTGDGERDSVSKIYNVTLNRYYDMDIKNAVLAEIYDNDLYVVSNENNDLKVARYDLAYDVVINDSANGSVSVDNSLKMAGEEVSISTSLMDGYVLDNLTVLDVDGEKVDIVNNKFVMPESDVYISATFIKGEKNPETSDFIVRTIFILFVCVALLFMVRNKRWKVE